MSDFLEFHENLLQKDVAAMISEIDVSSHLKVDAVSFLADHCVYGRGIVPATSFVEVMLSVGKTVQSSYPLVIEDLVIQQALFLSEARSVCLKTENLKSDSQAAETQSNLSFKILSSSAEGTDSSDQIHHVFGHFRLGEATPLSLQSISEDSIWASGTESVFTTDHFEPVSAEAYYQGCSARGIDYGETFQVIQQLWRKEGEALGQVQLCEALSLDLDQYAVHPILLDSALQVLWAALPDSTAGQTYLPVGIKQLQVHGPLPQKIWSRARLQPDVDSASSTFTADVQILDDAGTVLVELAGVLVEQVSETALLQPVQPQQTMAIAATFTAEPIADSLSFWTKELKLPYQSKFAPYNQVFQTLLNPDSLTGKNLDGVNVILARLEDWDSPITPLPLQVTAAEQANILAGSELRYTLPNQLEIAHLNPYETEYLFQELFLDLVYLKRGIVLNDGDCVVDIGANIGLFTLFAQQQCPNGSIYSFEPAPHAFDKLQRNASLYCTNTHLFNCGLSSDNTTETFTFYPNSSVFSSFSADDESDEKAIRAVILNMLERDGTMSAEDRDALAEEFLSDRLKKETYQAQLRTLSSVIEDCGIERIDLLKLDAEKSELPVLRGIKDEHWPMIQQMVVEVHDQVGDIIAEVKQILTDRGFDWEIDEEAMLQSSGLYNIYATRVGTKKTTPIQATDNAGVELERNVKDFCAALSAATTRTATPHIVCICPPSQRAMAAPNRQALYHKVEEQLTAELQTMKGVHLLDRELLTTTYVVSHYDDPHSHDFGKVPYTSAFFAALGTAVARTLYTVERSPYKVIVLDCDNTLWQGVCGEEGAQGVQISDPFQQLQSRMVEQHDAGVLLCLCSKNSEADVWAVFDQRPEMRLQKSHLVQSRINWQAKSENIKSLAAELNLGLDSFIFIDDNPVECAEVQANCPEVLTLQLPSEPTQIPVFLEHVWALDHLATTAEDAKRTALYQQGVQREAFRQETLTFGDFLAGLNLQISIEQMTEMTLPRVSQLTQRTNQFNVTTIRSSESEIQKLCDAGHECWVVAVRDRFGDYGTVGMMLFKAAETALVVHSFMLSCRSLGRGVEYEMLATLGRMAQARGLSQVEINYRPTAKNQPVLDFLQAASANFQINTQAATSAERQFQFPADLAAQLAYDPERESAQTTDQTADQATDTTVSTTRQASPSHRTSPSPSPSPMAWQPSRSLVRIANEQLTPEQLLNIISGNEQRARPQLDKAFVEAKTTVEAELAKIWANVLGLAQVGVHDNFFELGGKSLLMVQVHSQLCDRFNSNLSPVDLFKYPTVHTLAQRLQENIAQQSIEGADTGGPAKILAARSQASNSPQESLRQRADRKRNARQKRQRQRGEKRNG